MIERARDSMGRGPVWTQRPARVVITLPDGTEFVWTDASLSGVASIVRLFET